MMIDIIKNPVIIGLTVGVLVYLYIKWDSSKKEDKNKDKNKRKDSNILIPLFLGTLSWFIANNYYDFNETSINNNNNLTINNNYEVPGKLNLSDSPMIGGDGGINLMNNVGNKFNMNTNMNPNPNLNPIYNQPSSYHLLKKGITIPNNMTLPDIMIENF